jgi:hypothetical protein
MDLEGAGQLQTYVIWAREVSNALEARMLGERLCRHKRCP